MQERLFSFYCELELELVDPLRLGCLKEAVHRCSSCGFLGASGLRPFLRRSLNELLLRGVNLASSSASTLYLQPPPVE